MRQRICSVILVITLLVGSMCGLQGCGKESENTAYITQGEWITLINEAFGMYGYVEETPYYTNIPIGSPYYEQVQIAREWEVIDGSVSEFDTSAYVTYAFAAVTLINATRFVDEEVSAGQKVSIAEDMGFIITDKTDYDIEDCISYNDAVVSLYFAKQQWANFTFDHVIEEVTFADDVVNYIEEDFTDYEIQGNETYIPAYAYTEMKEGDVYVLPANEDNLVASAFIVENIRQEGDYYIIENSAETEDILEHIEELNIEETYSPDLLACDFYDGNDNLVYQGSEYAYAQRLASEGEYVVDDLVAKSKNATLVNLGEKPSITVDEKGKVSFEFPVDKKTTVKGSFGKDSVSFGLDYKFYSTNISTDINNIGNKDNGKESALLFFEATVSDIKVTNDIDMSWGKIRNARLAVDYKETAEFGIKADSSLNLYRAAPYNNGNGSFITNLKKAVTSDMVPGYAKGAEGITGDIKIGSFDLASIGIAKVKLTIFVYVEASGKMSVKLTYQATKGVEYSNGKVRYINTENYTPEFILNASIEGGLNFSLSAVVFKINVVAVDLKVGLGLEASLTVHFVDNENHLIETGNLGEVDVEITNALQECGATISLEDMQQIAEQQGGIYEGTIVTEKIPLHIDNCLQVQLYVKVSIGVSSKCTLAKLIKSVKKAKLELKTDLLTAHVDNLSDITYSGLLTGNKTTECTKKFTPFKALEEELAKEEQDVEETMTYEFEKGEYLGISQYSISLEEGETNQIQVTILPKNYELKDVKFECGDESIARVSDDGTILGLNAGVTYIRVYIPDTQFEMRCAVVVGEEYIVPFSPIDNL